MKERVKFVLEWERRWNEARGGRVDFSELCRRFGVHRDTGYYWLKRYRDANHDVRALEERSRRPKTSPTAIAEETQDLVVAARKTYPRWGPRKLRGWLVDRFPNKSFPSPSCIGDILKRRGLVRVPRRRKRLAIPSTQPFSECRRSNDVWCIDFKGKFRTKDGQWCHILTITDAFSRFLIRAEALYDPNGKEVERVCDSAFLEFGLPEAIRSDNGPPFASTGAGGFTRLNVWWLRLGLCLQRITPGKPQQNGRHERMHLTLEECVTPPKANLRAQQRAIDLWRREFNYERPHEALGQKPPARFYELSSRRYPRKLYGPEIPPWTEHALVDKQGFIVWRRNKFFVTTALWNELVTLHPRDDSKWNVAYGGIEFGSLDPERPSRGIIRRKRIIHLLRLQDPE